MARLDECRIDHLHPTQMTVGMIEVHDRRRKLRAMSHDERRDYLRSRAIPAVLGPGERLYLIDHHHLGRALHDESIEHGFFLVEADLSALAAADFWAEMARQQWTHPVDETGRRHDVEALPRHLSHLVDDPYRSLAGYVRRAGGYAKTPAPFAEFRWADFFRSRVPIAPGREGFEAAVALALPLAHASDARHLPGWLPLEVRDG